MGLGGGNPSGGIEKANRRQQALISQGMDQLNAIFFGGTTNGYTQAKGKFDPTQQYYRIGEHGGFRPYKPPGQYDPLKDRRFAFTGDWKKDWLDTSLGGIPLGEFLFGHAPPSPQSILRKGNLFLKNPTQTYQGFTPDFYNKAATDYLQFALPQLAQQARTQQSQINFNLANRGLLGSSAQTSLNKALGNEVNLQRIGIANNALARRQQLQKDINQQYTSLVNQLQLSANPSAVAQQALQAASSFAQPSPVQPIGSLFQNFANTYLGSQQYNTYNNQPGFNGGGFNRPSSPTSTITH